MCAILGYGEDELLAKTFQAITHPDDLETYRGYGRQMLAGDLLAVRLLEKEGHTVAVATTGAAAVAAFDTASFDLVLMDLQMPDMDGLAATAEIRWRERNTADLASPHTPIIAMTAHALNGDEERCLQAGMDGYVAKPIDPTRLFALIGSLLAADTFVDSEPTPPVLAVAESCGA